MKYIIYYENEKTHRPVEFRDHTELEKFITRAEECGLNFKEEPEAGAVFFTDRQGKHIGFYMEDNNE